MTALATSADTRKARPSGRLNPTYLGIELRRSLRNPWTLGFSLAMPVGLYLFFGTGTSNAHEWLGRGDVAGIVLAQLALYGAMSAATNVAGSVSDERASGWNRQLRLTPLRPGAYVAGKLACSLVVTFVLVGVMYAVGAATGARLEPTLWASTFALAWLGGTLLFSAFGLAVGYLFRGEAVLGVAGPSLTVFAFLGGLFIPLELLGSVIRTIAPWTPMWGLGQLERELVTGSALSTGAVVNVLAWFALFAGVALWRFRRVAGRG